MLGEVYQPTGHRFEAGELMPEQIVPWLEAQSSRGSYFH